MATRKNPTRAKIDPAVEDRRLVAISVIEQVGLTVRWLGVIAGLCFFTWCVHLIIDALAGRATNANIVLSLLANVDFSAILLWGAGAGGVGYGYSQNRLRKRTVSHLHRRIQQYERELDPNRSSSNLSSTGDTNPEDA
ncbi:MAG: hypothetical protein EON54_01365 [Alcaligenaceae bacterium]|nr:MAG: hypothetical protein EON54_01365 [Alcaligenaceae bacterium]